MPNKLSQFWQELKRRKVVRVITVYAAAAFVILELVDIITEPFGLPDWTLKLAVVIQAIGLIVAIILSWIYDIHPEGGIVKTEPAGKAKTDEIPKPTNSWRIATYVSLVVIIGLLVFNIFGIRETVEIDEFLAKSIAVLPFHNYSGDPDQDPMCLGLTDEIISNLYKVKSFDEVRSLTTVLNYQDPVRNIPLIADELKVNYILEGSFKRIGDEIRITAQLIEPKSDKHIWLQDYNLPYKEVIGIPAEVALQIADHLKAFTTAFEQQRIERIPTINEHAFEIVQKCKYYYIRRDNSFQFEDSLLKAIELDPEYADPYALMGFVALLDLTYAADPTRNTRSTVYDALPYINHALELDPENAYAHWIRGHYNKWVTWNYVEALKNYKKAADIEPKNILFTGSYSTMLMMIDQREKVMGQFLTTDGIRLQAKYGNLEEYEKFKEEYLNRVGDNGLTTVGESYLWLEEYDSARYCLEKAVRLRNLEMTTSRYLACLALAYQNTDEPTKAREIVNELITRSNNSLPGSPEFYIGWFYSGINKVDSAFHWLEKAYNRHSAELSWLRADPVLENIRYDERYWDLYERTGHKAYDEYLASKKQ